MTLMFHILIAITSITLATYSIIRPTNARIKSSYGLIVATLGTGALLMIDGANVLHVCLSGLIYSAVALGSTELARRRLVALRSSM